MKIQIDYDKLCGPQIKALGDFCLKKGITMCIPDRVKPLNSLQAIAQSCPEAKQYLDRPLGQIIQDETQVSFMTFVSVAVTRASSEKFKAEVEVSRNLPEDDSDNQLYLAGAEELKEKLEETVRILDELIDLCEFKEMCGKMR